MQTTAFEEAAKKALQDATADRMLLMEKMLPHLGFVQPSSFHMLSQLARPMPVSLGQQMASLPALPPISGNHPLKLCPPLSGRDSAQHPLAFSVLGRGTSFLENGSSDVGTTVTGGLPSPYDRDDDKGMTLRIKKLRVLRITSNLYC